MSTPPAEELDDRVSLPRGMALTILEVDARACQGPKRFVQDFLMVDGPVFNAPDAKHFLGSLKQLAATTDKAEGEKRVLSVLLRSIAAALGAAGVESSKLISMGGHQQTHPLGATFYTQVPHRHGDSSPSCRWQVSTSLTRLKDVPVVDRPAEDPDGLRQAANDFFASQSGE